MQYKTGLLGDGVKQQYFYDSEDLLYWVVLYNEAGRKLKVCSKSETEQGAYELAALWARENLQIELLFIKSVY